MLLNEERNLRFEEIKNYVEREKEKIRANKAIGGLKLFMPIIKEESENDLQLLKLMFEMGCHIDSAFQNNYFVISLSSKENYWDFLVLSLDHGLELNNVYDYHSNVIFIYF